MRHVVRLSIATLGLATAWFAGSASVIAHTQHDFEAPIAEPRSESVAPGEFVVSFAVGGELHGLLTLRLNRSESGVSGEWVLVTSTVPDGDAEHSEHEHGVGDVSGEPHLDLGPPAFSGTLAGSVTAASLAFDEHDTLIAIDTATLSIASGSLRFAGASGSGEVEAVGIDAAGAATALGTLRLDVTSENGGH